MTRLVKITAAGATAFLLGYAIVGVLAAAVADDWLEDFFQ